MPDDVRTNAVSTQHARLRRGERLTKALGLFLGAWFTGCSGDLENAPQPCPSTALQCAGNNSDAETGASPSTSAEHAGDTAPGSTGDANTAGNTAGTGEPGTTVNGDDADTSDAAEDAQPTSIEEPPLPPPLSAMYAAQRHALSERRRACGLPEPAALPDHLAEHLTTATEYAAHRACLTSIATSACTSEPVQSGQLAAWPSCLVADSEVYDALAPPASCPYEVNTFTFDARRQRFSLHNAYWLLWMATACNLAEPDLIEAELATRGFTDVRVIQHERLTVAVVDLGEVVIFVFKGSTETSDYLSNAAYAMKPTEETGLPGRVHNGFFSTLASGFPALEVELRRAHELGQTVIFAGHSLGGACAQMAAWWAHDIGVEVAQLYSFASPRVGDRTFVTALEGLLGDRMHRINNGLDITPHVPPSATTEDAAREAILEILGDAEDPGFALGTVSVTLQAGLLLADYTHVGTAYAFDVNGYLQPAIPDRDDEENAYWRGLPAVVGQDDLSDITAGFGRLPAYHDDSTQVCYQARAITQLLYPRE